MKVYKKAHLPLGFNANGLTCGIKKSGKLDLALFYSQTPARASAKFTTNKIIAAPLIINKERLKKGKYFKAIIVNSGNANCFTAKPGIKDAQAVSSLLSKELCLKNDQILLASTGIIGRRLPVDKIRNAIPNLVKGLSQDGIDKAKLAILTTDTFAKEISVKLNLGEKTITICGIAKGAGMIAPHMATLLVFIFTDANITQKALNKSLTAVVEQSFNCITIDGCMSTNDSLICLANSAAGNSLIKQGNDFELFTRALKLICVELAKMVVKDAEGASKFIQINVMGAKTLQDAKNAGLAVANSNLFKTAIYGENPNFGRIAAAVGASGASVKEDNLKIKVSPLKKKEIKVDINLNSGHYSAVIYTSDLTPEYIKINAEYN